MYFFSIKISAEIPASSLANEHDAKTLLFNVRMKILFGAEKVNAAENHSDTKWVDREYTDF